MSEMRNFLPNPRPYDMSGWQSCNPAKLAVERHDDDRNGGGVPVTLS